MSANVAATPSSPPQRPSSRMPGRVDQAPAARQRHQVAGGRGVAPLGVAGAHLAAPPAPPRPARALTRLTTCRRRTRRSARASGRAAPARQRVEAVPGARAGARRRPRPARRGRCAPRAASRSQVGLGQGDQRGGARLPGEGGGAVEAAVAQRPVEALDGHDQVHVAGDHLLGVGASGRAAGEHACGARARRRSRPSVQRDPVAGREARPATRSRAGRGQARQRRPRSTRGPRAPARRPAATAPRARGRGRCPIRSARAPRRSSCCVTSGFPSRRGAPR